MLGGCSLAAVSEGLGSEFWTEIAFWRMEVNSFATSGELIKVCNTSFADKVSDDGGSAEGDGVAGGGGVCETVESL